MRGIPPALPIIVNERIRELLEQERAKTSISHSYKRRLEIISDAVSGKSMYSTSKRLNMKWDTVQKWRKRWESESGQLKAAQQGTTRELLKVIKQILSDRPRGAKPRKFTLAQEQQIIAIACDRPEDHGLEVTNWTWQLIADIAVAKSIVHEISRRHVGTLLKKTN